ncbi:protein of unknown function (plasmid) [Azospirillum baldaniorum]|uniref:Uncharacterized protein n=1 Tax=Azospirillum baldaniorum TaxID=1064539 RepID=A0A9P1NNT7_9PROT|nr:protein of unknown function [Azospirillum baldaniorum]
MLGVLALLTVLLTERGTLMRSTHAAAAPQPGD